MPLEFKDNLDYVVLVRLVDIKIDVTRDLQCLHENTECIGTRQLNTGQDTKK